MAERDSKAHFDVLLYPHPAKGGGGGVISKSACPSVRLSVDMVLLVHDLES